MRTVIGALIVALVVAGNADARQDQEAFQPGLRLEVPFGGRMVPQSPRLEMRLDLAPVPGAQAHPPAVLAYAFESGAGGISIAGLPLRTLGALAAQADGSSGAWWSRQGAGVLLSVGATVGLIALGVRELGDSVEESIVNEYEGNGSGDGQGSEQQDPVCVTDICAETPGG